MCETRQTDNTQELDKSKIDKKEKKKKEKEKETNKQNPE